MARKTDKMCIICGETFKGTAKAKVCTKNSNCRVQLKRLLDKGQKPPFETLSKTIINATAKFISSVQIPKVEILKTNEIPVRKAGENAIDFAARKSEWKLKNKT